MSGLSESTDEKEMKEKFKSYGCVNHMWLAKHPPWIAYVFFDKERCAIEAVRDLDGKFVLLQIIVFVVHN